MVLIALKELITTSNYVIPKLAPLTAHGKTGPLGLSAAEAVEMVTLPVNVDKTLPNMVELLALVMIQNLNHAT